MQVQGKCHCGRVTYTAEVDPEKVSICHCSDCQMLTGSAYRVSVQVPSETFRLLSGQPRTYIKTAESGNKRAHSFCGDCGTPTFARAAVDDPPTYSLRIGCLEQRAALPPRRQHWCHSALPWSQDISGIPKNEYQ
jgi:hypothetical protein